MAHHNLPSTYCTITSVRLPERLTHKFKYDIDDPNVKSIEHPQCCAVSDPTVWFHRSFIPRTSLLLNSLPPGVPNSPNLQSF